MNTTKLFHKNFTLIVLGQIISLLGNAILSFALPLHLLNITGDGTIFGVVMAVSILPVILLSPIGGTIADRVNRKNIMVFLDFITCSILLISSIFIKSNAVICLSVMLISLAVIRSFYQPSVQASIPSITSKENLLKGNSVVNMVNSFSLLLGPILGGILYGIAGITPILFISSATFFISAVMELFIKIPNVNQAFGKNVLLTVREDFSESINFITKKNPIIAKTISIAALINMILSSLIIVGVPYIINIVFEFGSEMYGVAQSMMGVGALCGGILVGTLAGRLNLKSYHKPLLYASLSILPIGIGMMNSIPEMVSFWLIAISSGLVMLFAAMFSVMAITVIQQLTPPEITGKVMSFAVTISMCAQPIGTAAYGFLFENMSESIDLIIYFAASILLLIVYMSRRVFYEVGAIEDNRVY